VIADVREEEADGALLRGREEGVLALQLVDVSRLSASRLLFVQTLARGMIMAEACKAVPHWPT
jgi:hypothetical protein